MKRQLISLIALLLLSSMSQAGGPPPMWSHSVLDPSITPLENRIAPLGPASMDPDLLVFSLRNAAPNDNRLRAFHVPAPYDGTGVTMTTNIDSGPLFGVGDICVVEENRAIVPYVKANGGNFDVFVAEFSGGGWTTNPIAATSSDTFHSSDCFITTEGVFIMAHNDTDESIDFFSRPQTARSAFQSAFTWDEVELGGVPRSPFDSGAIASAEAQPGFVFANPIDDHFGASIAVQGSPNDSLQIGLASSFDGSFWPRSFGGATFEQGLHLSGTIDGAWRGLSQPGHLWIVNQRNGNLDLTRVGYPDPDDDTTITLGAITPGSLLGFQGMDLSMGPEGMLYVVADKSYRVDPETLQVTPIAGYPFEGLGGPVNIDFSYGMAQGFATGPGSQVLGVLDVGVLFADGFESGNTNFWDVTLD